MSTTFRPYAPDQMLLLPADLRACCRRATWDLVDGVDLTAFSMPVGATRAPRMMVKVLLYA